MLKESGMQNERKEACGARAKEHFRLERNSTYVLVASGLYVDISRLGAALRFDENLKLMASSPNAPQAHMQDDEDGLIFDDELDDIGHPITSGEAASTKADEEAREKEKQEGKDDAAAVDVEIRRRKRAVPNFNENHLVGSKGIASLHYLAWHHMRGMGGKPLFHGEGHEVSDLARLMDLYGSWARRMYPRDTLEDILAKLTRLSSRQRVKNELEKARLAEQQWRRDQKPEKPHVWDMTANSTAREEEAGSTADGTEDAGTGGASAEAADDANSAPASAPAAPEAEGNYAGAATAPAPPSQDVDEEEAEVEALLRQSAPAPSADDEQEWDDLMQQAEEADEIMNELEM